MNHLMKNQITSFAIILFFFLLSCDRKESKYIFDQYPISNLQDVKIKEVVTYEKQQHAIERKKAIAEYRLGMAFNYSEIETLARKVFNRKDTNLFLETDYYYTKKDSILKFVIHTWRIKAFLNLNSNKAKNEADYNTIKQKYKDLKKNLSMQLKITPKALIYKGVTLWETQKADVFINTIDEKTENPGIYLFIKLKKNGL